MGFLSVLFLLFVTPTTAFDSERKCTNLVIPIPRYHIDQKIVPKEKSRIPTSINPESSKLDQFISTQPIENQKLLAALLWNELKVKRRVDDKIGELERERKILEKSNTALAVYSEIGVDAAARAAHRNKVLTGVLKTQKAAHRQVEAVVIESKRFKLKNPINDSTLRMFFTDANLNTIQDFNRYIAEALRLDANAQKVIELVKIRVQQKNEFSLLTKECMAGDPLAEAIARKNYELVNVYNQKTYAMNFECSKTEDQCLETFKDDLVLKGCRLAEKISCVDQGKKTMCTAETHNCFDTYRDESLGTVARAGGCPVGFRYENTENYKFCLMNDF